MNCEKCKYWQKSGEGDYPQLIDAGECKKAKMFWESTDWFEDDETFVVDRRIKEEFKDNGVFVQDGSDYSARMITQPDFGCVKFEEA